VSVHVLPEPVLDALSLFAVSFGFSVDVFSDFFSLVLDRESVA
jgi:hypothetical protein